MNQPENNGDQPQPLAPAAQAAITMPVTPPAATHGTHLTQAPSMQPHVNVGVVNVNGFVQGHITHNGQQTAPTPFQGRVAWRGPPAESGNLAHPDDPFVSASGSVLAASAPVFVPGPPHLPPPGQGGSPAGSSPDGASSSSNNEPANRGGNASGSDDSAKGNGRSSATNSKSSDGDSPVIVNGSKPNSACESRFLRVENVNASDFNGDKIFGYIKATTYFREDVQKNGVFCLKPAGDALTAVFMFSDSLSTARRLHMELSENFRVTYLTYEEFRSADVEIPEEIDRFSAKITLNVAVKERSRRHNFGVRAITDMATTAAAKFGRILHFAVSGVWGTGLKFDIEYDSVKDAYDVVLNTNPAAGTHMPQAQAEHILLRAEGHEPMPVVVARGANGWTYSASGRTGTRVSTRGTLETTSGYANPNCIPGPAARAPPGYGQFDGAELIWERQDPTAAAPMLDQNGLPHPDISRPQDVVDKKIEDGSDVRTTLMIRNIPQEMTGQMLVDILNACVHGQFDFAYNRIDFRQNQSVGYGFVNFTSSDMLLKFVRAWRGHLFPHNVYRRHLRPCAVSYANVQGFECLVAKFRNSSILEEAEGCRPKLFWSNDTASSPDQVGQERKFPRVDNESKKFRSMENAQIAGLYAPRARTNAGRGGRQRFSQFDRGTSAHQQDERYNFNYDTTPSNMAPAYGYAPRTFPQPVLYHPNMHQFVPAPMPYNMGYQAAGSVLRSHTQGQLGYTNTVMPAQLAQVNNPSQVQAGSQDAFQPLLHPVKGVYNNYYRSY